MRPVTLELADTKHPLYKRLSTLGIPANKTEQYRHFAIKPILARNYNIEIPKENKPIEGSKLIIENGIIKEYPKGSKISFNQNFEADNEHFDALYFLSHIMSNSVICIEVTQDMVFELEHYFTKEKTFLPYRISIKTAPNTRVEVIETFHTKETKGSLLLYGIDANIAKDSTLRWIRHEGMVSGETIIIGTHRYDVNNQGALELKTFDFGNANILHLYKIDLSNYAWTEASHLLLATKDAHRGNVVLINHNQPYAKSVQEARSILKGEAIGIFDGRICVHHDAKYSNAKQNSKAILLNEKTHMYVKPQLEIYIDELEASHGSTIGQLDENALFYLRSRGIALNDAKKILVLAFADILIDSIRDDTLRNKIHKEFETTYYED